MSVQEAIDRACADVGIVPPRRIVEEGKWIKTDTFARHGKGDGRLKINEWSVTAHNWQTGESATVKTGRADNPVERRKVERAFAKKHQDEERKKVDAARIAQALVGSAQLSEHPYLVRKGFPDERALVVPAARVRDIGGRYLIAGDNAIVMPARIGNRITSVQLIWEDGTKKFLFGGEVSAASHRLATGVDTWLCEGYATGLSLRMALHGLKIRATVLCCFSASNVTMVARSVKGRCFVAADNDPPPKHNPEQFNGFGAGEYYARKTEAPYGMPPDVGSDFNDMHQRAGIFAVQRVLTSTMSGRRAA